MSRSRLKMPCRAAGEDYLEIVGSPLENSVNVLFEEGEANGVIKLSHADLFIIVDWIEKNFDRPPSPPPFEPGDVVTLEGNDWFSKGRIPVLVKSVMNESDNVRLVNYRGESLTAAVSEVRLLDSPVQD